MPIAETNSWRDDLPEEYRPQAPAPWQDVADDFKKQFPLLAEGAMRKHYEEASKQALARSLTPEEDAGERWLRKSYPLVSTVISAGQAHGYTRAQERLAAGTPEEGDYDTVAKHEAQQKGDEERGKTWGGALGAAAENLPRIGGEFALAGAATKALAGLPGMAWLAPEVAGAAGAAAEGGTVAIPRFLSTEGLKAAAKAAPAYLGREAVQTAVVPSMYVDHLTQSNMAKGRDALDVRGFPQAFGLGMVQNATLGVVNKYAGKYFPGEGVGQAVGRVGTQAGVGFAAQPVMDVATSAVGLDTGYGSIGQALGWGGDGRKPDPEGALRNATVTALTFAAFGAAHEPEREQRAGPDPTMTAYADALRRMAGRGMQRDAASRALMQPADILASLHEQNPNPSRAEVAQAMQQLPEGPVRDWGLAVARTIPKTPTAPSVEPFRQSGPGGAARPEQAPAGRTPPPEAPGADGGPHLGPSRPRRRFQPAPGSRPRLRQQRRLRRPRRSRTCGPKRFRRSPSN